MDRIDKSTGLRAGQLHTTLFGASCLPVTVVISTRNRPEMLLETVQGIFQADCLPAELIAVDQSDTPVSEPHSLSDFSGCQIRYIHLPTPGASNARNLGARLATHDLLLFLDDDLTVDRGWLSAFIGELERQGLGVVLTGQVREISAGPGQFAPSCTTGTTRVRYKGRVPRDVLSSGNMAIHRGVFEAIGGFDERLGPGKRFPAAEDNDFAYRLLQAGYEIEYLPEALAWHRAWRSESDVVSLQWRYGRGQGAFYAKHLKSTGGFMVRRLLFDLARPIRSFPDRVRSRRLRRALGDLAYAAAVLVSLVEWRGYR